MEKTAKIFVAGHKWLVWWAIVKYLSQQWYSNIITKTRAEMDLLNVQQVAEFFAKEKPEYVFFAAAKVGWIVANNTYPADFLYQNLQIQNNIIHNSYLSGVKKMLFLGSSCIYPKLCPQPIKEEYLLTGPLEQTNEPYAIAKITGMKMCQSYNRQYGTNFIACMPTNLYGPGDNFDLQNSHVLPAMMRKFHEAKKENKTDVTLRGDGSPMREFLFVDDLATACVFLMDTFTPTAEQNLSGDIFVNIGRGEDVTIKDLAMLVQKDVWFEGNIIWDTSKPNWTPRKLLDVSKINAMWRKAQTSLEQGIEKTYKWFLENI